MSNDDKARFNKPTASALNPDAPSYIPIAMKRKVQSDVGNFSLQIQKKHLSSLRRFAKFMWTLDPIVRKRVEVLKQLQRQQEELQAKFREESIALEVKYEKLRQPLDTKRFEIVNGICKVEDNTDEAAKDQYENKTELAKGVPNFWLNAIINVMKTNELMANEIRIHKKDKAVLKDLQDIKWSRIHDPKGFKLEFFFATNSFFKNHVLTKTYHLVDEYKPILEKIIGTDIDWYPGKCLTQKNFKRKQNNLSHFSLPRESFFKFFKSEQVPDALDDEEDDDDDDDYEADLDDYQTAMKDDYEIGLIFRDKIIPQALYWFSGEAQENGEFYDDMDDDFDSDFSEEEKHDNEYETNSKLRSWGQHYFGDRYGDQSPKRRKLSW